VAGRFKLTAPVVRETPLHTQIADAFRLELCAPGKISRKGVTWWSNDMAAYAGTAPGIRTARGCIAGVPDIYVQYRGAAHFIEVKAEDGMVSLEQQSVATAILLGRGRWGAARNADEALALLDAWGIPRNGHIRGAAYDTQRQSQRTDTASNGAHIRTP
jgi:hypothetical protein